MKKIWLIVFLLSICSANISIANEDIIQQENGENQVLISEVQVGNTTKSKAVNRKTLRENLEKYPQYYTDKNIKDIISSINWKDVTKDFPNSFYSMLSNGELNYFRDNYKILRNAGHEQAMTKIRRVILAMKKAEYSDEDIRTFFKYSGLEYKYYADFNDELFTPSFYVAIEKGYIVIIAQNTNYFRRYYDYYNNEGNMSELVAYLDKLIERGFTLDMSCNLSYVLIEKGVSLLYVDTIISIVEMMLQNKYSYKEIMSWVRALYYSSNPDAESITPICTTFVENRIPFNTLSERKLKIWYEIYKISPDTYMELIKQGVFEPTEEMVEYISDVENRNKLITTLRKQDFEPKTISRVISSNKIDSKRKISAMKSIQRYDNYEKDPYLLDDSQLEGLCLITTFVVPALPALPLVFLYGIGSRASHDIGRVFYKKGIKYKTEVGL